MDSNFTIFFEHTVCFNSFWDRVHVKGCSSPMIIHFQKLFERYFYQSNKKKFLVKPNIDGNLFPTKKVWNLQKQ